MTERLIDVHDARLCTESFGDPADPPVLLIMGVGARVVQHQARSKRAIDEDL